MTIPKLLIPLHLNCLGEIRFASVIDDAAQADSIDPTRIGDLGPLKVRYLDTGRLLGSSNKARLKISLGTETRCKKLAFPSEL
jgi:hypothetical protein